MPNDNQPPLAPHKSKEGLDALNVTFAITDDVPVAEPSSMAKAAFGLSFLPILGVIGLGLALYRVFLAHKSHEKVHGLVYGAIALQLFYGLFILTGIMVSAQVMQTTVSVETSEEKTAQSFLQAVRSGQAEQAQAYFIAQEQASGAVIIPIYRQSITSTPLLIWSQAAPTGQYSAANLKAYNGLPRSYQLWRVGGKDRTLSYLTILLVQTTDGQWHIAQVQAVETAGDASARAAAEQALGQISLPTP